jgi:hypothetical protein
MENRIIIRSVFKITKAKLEPSKDPKTGRFAATVREVDSDGDMILSEADRKTNKFFVKSNDFIEIYDGKEFNLDDEIDLAWWEAIKNTRIIAQERMEKDAAGNLTIDGSAKRYGIAEFYVERPGAEAKSRITRKQLLHKAEGFILGDSPEGTYQKARILGHEMKGSPLSDVQDYLLIQAEKNPEKIIDLYTGSDTQLRILLLDALDKKVIINRTGLFYYADTILGSTEEAVINWFKQTNNKTLFGTIKAECYPELLLRTKKEIVEDESPVGEIESPYPINKTKTK